MGGRLRRPRRPPLGDARERFWPALGCILFWPPWQYRGTLGGGIEDYDPTRGFASDSYHKVVLETREAPWRYFTGGFLASAYLRSRIFYRPLSSLYFWTNRKLFDLIRFRGG